MADTLRNQFQMPAIPASVDEGMKKYLRELELALDAMFSGAFRVAGELEVDADITIDNGVLTVKETTTPTARTDYGKVYPKSDNKLYFQDGAGNEHEIAVV